MGSKSRLQGNTGQNRLFIGLLGQVSLWLLQGGTGGRTPDQGLG